MISKRGRTICTAAAFFGDASPHNAAVLVPMCGNTTIAESYTIKKTLSQAKAEAVRRLCIVIDNAAALQFTASVVQAESANSASVSDYINRYPQLSTVAKQIKEEVTGLNFLAVVWQKSHTTERSIFSQANNGADRLCRGYADTVAARLLTQ